MTLGEILVVVVALFAGWRIVSFFMGGGKVAEPIRAETARGDAPAAPAAIDPLRWDAVLGVSPSASEAEIRAAYRSLMSQYHPDKVAALGQELRDLAERKSKEIGAAYSTAMKARGFAE